VMPFETHRLKNKVVKTQGLKLCVSQKKKIIWLIPLKYQAIHVLISPNMAI
jgi:hypothetical protein